MRQKCYFLVVMLFFVLGCAKTDNSQILAKVNNQVITVKDLENRISKSPSYYRSLAQQNKKKFLDDMIGEIIFVQEALKNRLDQNKDVRDLVAEARNKILISKLIEEKVEKRAVVTDDQIQQFYEQHRDQFVIPEKMRASHIMVSSEGKAKEILKRLKSGEDFAELARNESQDASKDNGGDIGYFTKGQMIPEFEEACFKLQVGELSEPVKTKLGYHIVRVTDRINAQAEDLSVVKQNIKEELLKVIKRNEFDKLVENLKKNSNIQINEKLLNELDKKAASTQEEKSGSK